MLIAISTQLLCGPSPGPKDVNPFIDAAMVQVTIFPALLVSFKSPDILNILLVS
jgi:hypothetical protein